MSVSQLTAIAVVGKRRGTLHWDVLAALLVLGLLVVLAEASRDVTRPLAELARHPVSLDPAGLPGYAALTALRMLAGLVLSLVFTFTYATWAAKSRRAAAILIPLLDILQSVPILGFISVTAVFFMALTPRLALGAELTAVFAIFTSQAWNMAFSFYQSLRTVPEELTEAARSFRLGAWMRFWRLEVPFAMPALIWNMMMSMSGAWFFVVAAEAISVGRTHVVLPGVGSYIALAIADRRLGAVAWAIGTMLVVILVYDQLLFRPLVAWADKFRFEQETSAPPPRAWALTMLRRSRLVGLASRPLEAAWRHTYRPPREPRPARRPHAAPRAFARTGAALQALGGGLLAAWVLWNVGRFVGAGVGLRELGTAALLGFATMLRVLALIAIASAIWVPVGILIGLRPRAARIAQPVAQFLAAFPANLLFPLVVSGIVAFRLDPDVWLSPLMILGTQWYILFNVVAGASTIPSELRDIGRSLDVRGWLWWRKIALPAVFPFYLTGAIAASGGSWNASIVAELATWGPETLHAHGLGAYIAEATAAGDYHRIVLGIAVMCAFVVVINRVLWRPLYLRAERKYRLG